MTDRALVTLRAELRDPAILAQERALLEALAAHGVSIEPVELPHATLVTGPLQTLRDLASSRGAAPTHGRSASSPSMVRPTSPVAPTWKAKVCSSPAETMPMALTAALPICTK